MKLLKPVILDPVQGGNGSLRTTLYFLSHFRLEKQAFIQAKHRFSRFWGQIWHCLFPFHRGINTHTWINSGSECRRGPGWGQRLGPLSDLRLEWVSVLILCPLTQLMSLELGLSFTPLLYPLLFGPARPWPCSGVNIHWTLHQKTNYSSSRIPFACLKRRDTMGIFIVRSVTMRRKVRAGERKNCG